MENTFATRQLAVLAAGPNMRRNQNFDLGFPTFEMFPPPLFFSFGFLFAAVIGLLSGLLGVKKCLRKIHQGGQFLPWSS